MAELFLHNLWMLFLNINFKRQLLEGFEKPVVFVILNLIQNLLTRLKLINVDSEMNLE